MITKTSTGTFAIDAARSRIRFDTSHSFGIGPVHGTFAVRDGTVTLAADPARSTATARVDAASFTTDKPKRDSDVRSKRFLDAHAYPDLLFVSNRLSHDGDRWLLHGTLTARGNPAPVTLEITSAMADTEGCRFSARTRIDRYAHRVGPRGIAGRYLDVELDIVGAPVP
jgi:polyisoprenoid-binding protein YceI